MTVLFIVAPAIGALLVIIGHHFQQARILGCSLVLWVPMCSHIMVWFLRQIAYGFYPEDVSRPNSLFLVTGILGLVMTIGVFKMMIELEELESTKERR